jgi:ABC-type glycerol-3-phosphate transport system permease component
MTSTLERFSKHFESDPLRRASRSASTAQCSALEGQYAINVPAVMAAVLLSVLPLVVLFIVMCRQVMRSLGSVVMR